MTNKSAAIDGCDITPGMAEATKHFADLRYTALTHPSKLPYADNSFDRVISSGVLEHAPLFNESLLELNRVTEVGGYLIITFLPNRLSYTECACRTIFKRSQHLRLYSIRQLKRALLDHGFEPVEIGYHQVLPSLTAGHSIVQWPWLGAALRVLFKLDPLAERIWPLRVFGANIYAVARKRDYV
jgi:ubiquinone/menaquinone biosynthesis C-methylase UbiE